MATRAPEPEDFAPFSEHELDAFASRLLAAPASGRAGLFAEDAIGAALIETVGDADALVDALLSHWGEELAIAA